MPRLPFGWPAEACIFDDPLDYLGRDGGGGVGSAPGISVGAALALREAGSDRLPVAIIGDGEFVMGTPAIWTAAHYRIPVLIIVGNNRSFFNDEVHQERMARQRNRPVETSSQCPISVDIVVRDRLLVDGDQRVAARVPQVPFGPYRIEQRSIEIEPDLESVRQTGR